MMKILSIMVTHGDDFAHKGKSDFRFSIIKLDDITDETLVTLHFWVIVQMWIYFEYMRDSHYL